MQKTNDTDRTSSAPRFVYDATNGELVVRVLLSDTHNDDARAVFMEAVEGHFLTSPPKAIVFDITGHDLLSSGTLEAFLRCRKRGIDVWLRNASAHVKEILERTHLVQVIGIQGD
ncbi:MAG: hypothetical protein CMJ50_04060 [Planctomycetaceae bacterium]|nr:hypothetical protein [Planctomycetaceae bacterium]